MNLVVVSAALLALAGQVQQQPAGRTAQFVAGNFAGYPGGWGGMGMGGMGWGGWGGWHASTAAEGYYRGMSDVIRSYGQYNLMTSEAMINAEEARKGYIENRQRWTDTYFQMRRTNQAYQDEQSYAARQSAVEWVRWLKSQPPERLPSESLDPLTGVIHWPSALQDPHFADYRNELDMLFRQRAEADSRLSDSALAEVDRVLRMMNDDLSERAAELGYVSFTSANQFIKGLRSEAKLPPR